MGKAMPQALRCYEQAAQLFGRHAADLRQSRLQGGDADCLPSRGGSASSQDVGQHRPVLREICWVPGYWLKRDSDVNFVLDQVLRWHVSSVNIKLSAIPAQWKKEFKGIPKEDGLSFHLAAAGVPARRSSRANDAGPHVAVKTPGWRRRIANTRRTNKTRLELDILPISEYTVGGWVARA
ncbi:MAG: hypothetical protein DMG49_12470 [Acidobacteria bacterium]|nr:MAG: hypothetical protein DMG49_12470 [Acidobacteriota bacterium]